MHYCRDEGATSHHDSRSLYVPPTKRSRSEDDPTRHREQRSRTEHRDSRKHGHGSRERGREPDYVRNPSKWTKYDLKEDGSQVLRGMSEDQVNKYAAFEFLDQVKKRKIMSGLEQSGDTDPDEEEIASESAKVVFKKPKRKVGRSEHKESLDRDRTVDTQQSHVGSGGGVKMAEYVVGSKAAARLQRERKQKRAKLISIQTEEDDESDSKEDGKVAASGISSSSVCLSHLEEEQ